MPARGKSPEAGSLKFGNKFIFALTLLATPLLIKSGRAMVVVVGLLMGSRVMVNMHVLKLKYHNHNN